jgi:hypothetical protein
MQEGDLKLRHQRNADVEFDFVKPKSDDCLTEQKPEFIWEIIETLLPDATCNDLHPIPDRLLQLWSRPGTRRSSWTMISTLNI